MTQLHEDFIYQHLIQNNLILQTKKLSTKQASQIKLTHIT